jgi:hypothetical protein
VTGKAGDGLPMSMCAEHVRRLVGCKSPSQPDGGEG